MFQVLTYKHGCQWCFIVPRNGESSCHEYQQCFVYEFDSNTTWHAIHNLFTGQPLITHDPPALKLSTQQA